MMQKIFEDECLYPTSPKQFKVKEINAKNACKLNRIWHSLLPILHWSNIFRSKNHICFGFFYNGECFAVAIWSSPIARGLDAETILELRRYAIKESAPKNTASWGIKQMIKLIENRIPEIKTLISYQDTNMHNGTIYKASNWKPTIIRKYGEWSSLKRKRNKSQTMGDKIRWEFQLRNKKKRMFDEKRNKTVYIIIENDKEK